MKRYWPVTLVILGAMIAVPGVSSASPPGGYSKSITPKVVDFKVIDPKVMKVGDPKVSKLITPKVIDLKVIDPKVIDPKVTKIIIDPKVTKLVIDPKVTKIIIDPKITKLVVDPKKTFVIDPKVTKIIVGPSCHCCHHVCWPVCCPIVCWHPCLWGFCTIPVQDERYLRLHNDTAEVVTFYLRFHTHDFTGEWEWIPEPPLPTAEKWLAFELVPGQVLDTRFMDVPIAANRIRLWARSATRTWETYKEDDFWLVPEVLPSGEHLYYSEFRQTFTFRLTPK